MCSRTIFGIKNSLTMPAKTNKQIKPKKKKKPNLKLGWFHFRLEFEFLLNPRTTLNGKSSLVMLIAKIYIFKLKLGSHFEFNLELEVFLHH